MVQSSSGTDRPGAARQHLRLTLPSQLTSQSHLGDVPRDGSLAAMLAAFWEGTTHATACSTIGAACHCWPCLATADLTVHGSLGCSLLIIDVNSLRPYWHLGTVNADVPPLAFANITILEILRKTHS